MIVAAVGVALVIAGAIALRASLTPERLRAEVVRVTSDATGLPVQLDEATLSWMPFGVSIAGLRIGDDAGDEVALLQLESGLVHLDLGPLLRRRVVIDQIQLERPRLSLRRVDDEIVLPGKLAAKAAEAPSGSAPAASPGAAALPVAAGFAASIRMLEITDGAFQIDASNDSLRLQLTGIDLAASVDVAAGAETIASRGELSLADLSLTALDAYRETLDEMRPSLRFDVEFRTAEGVLHLEEVALVAHPLDLRFRGELTGMPEAPAIDLTLAPETFELAELLPLVPPAAWPEGRTADGKGPVTVSATVRGALGDSTAPPEVAVTLDFGGADLGMEGFPVDVRGLEGKIEATPERLAIAGLSGTIGDGRFVVDGSVADLDQPDGARCDLSVRAALDLSLVTQSGLAPEGVSMSGTVNADVQARGVASAPEGLTLAGTIGLEDGGVTAPTLPVPLHGFAGTVRLEGSNATLETLVGSIGRSSFKAAGVVRGALSKRPRLRLEGSSPLLDLAELAPAESRAGSAASGPGAGSTGPSDAPLVPPLPPIDAVLRFAVDSLITVGGAMSDVELVATLAEGKGRVETRVGRGDFGGVVLESFDADLALDGQVAQGAFRSPRVEAQRVPLTDVRGDLALGADKVLRVENVRAGLWTGEVRGQATVDISDPADPVFDIETTATGVEANDLLSTLTPAKDLLHGKLNLESTFHGRGTDPIVIAKGLTGSGEFDAAAGRIERTPAVARVWNALQLGDRETIPYQDLAAAFSVRDGRLLTDDVVIDSGDAKWNVSGSTSFDGMLDYQVEVELGERLSNHYKKQIGGQLGALLANTSGQLVVDLRVQGPAAKPQVTVDRQKLLKRAQKNAADSLKQRLEDEGKELLGGLKGLLGGK
jgi:uncharacterized protein involved in outer membrane biogenesis